MEIERVVVSTTSVPNPEWSRANQDTKYSVQLVIPTSPRALTPMDWQFDVSSDDINASEEMLDGARHRATAVWREDLKQYFRDPLNSTPAIVWEIVAKERVRSELETSDDPHLNYAITEANARADSYERYFSYEPIESGDGHWEYLKSFPSLTKAAIDPFELVISGAERLKIIGARPYALLEPSGPTSGNRIVDHYTSQRISVDRLSTTKIRRDLDFMWRHRLYADMQVVVPYAARSGDESEEKKVTVFSCHRWILISRSPYFREALERKVEGDAKKSRPLSTAYSSSKINHNFDLNVVPLPSPPFNPITVDFVLRFLYTATLQYPHQTFSSDRATAFSIYRAANFLRIPALKDLMAAHIVVDMVHGLFSASLSSSAFYELTGGLWKNMMHPGDGTKYTGGGCGCRQCSRRVPRILWFSVEPDIQDSILERGARRALVGLFGPGWCTQEFGTLSEDLINSVLEDLMEVITARNALPLLFASQKALEKLGTSPTFWDRPIRRALSVAKVRIGEVLCQQSRLCFYSDEWKDLITDHGQKDRWDKEYEDTLKLMYILDTVSTTMQPGNAGPLYQTLTWFTDAQVPPQNQNKVFSVLIGALTAKLYKIMMETRPTSIMSSASSIFETIDPSHNTFDALDLSSTSDLTSNFTVYSNPSSRTMSTEYGIYYTRMAISEDTIDTATIRRRRSWDSLSVYSEMQSAQTPS